MQSDLPARRRARRHRFPPYKLDIDKAKALLAEAGYPNGFPVTVNVASTEQLAWTLPRACRRPSPRSASS